MVVWGIHLFAEIGSQDVTGTRIHNKLMEMMLEDGCSGIGV